MSVSVSSSGQSKAMKRDQIRPPSPAKILIGVTVLLTAREEDNQVVKALSNCYTAIFVNIITQTTLEARIGGVRARLGDNVIRIGCICKSKART